MFPYAAGWRHGTAECRVSVRRPGSPRWRAVTGGTPTVPAWAILNLVVISIPATDGRPWRPWLAS